MDFYIPYVWPVKLKMLKQLFFGFPPLCWLVSPNEKKKLYTCKGMGAKKKKKKNNYLIFDNLKQPGLKLHDEISFISALGNTYN